MSDAPKIRPKVPDGKSRFLTTRQKPANEKGYIGYETIWEPFQKHVPYTTPKKPWSNQSREPEKVARLANAEITRNLNLKSVQKVYIQHL